MRALMFLSCLFAAAASGAPNIVFILADDAGLGDFSPYGNDAPTPHIQALADRGTTYTRFYVPASVCSAYRYAYTTGLHSTRLDIYHATDQQPIPLELVTISERLRAENYATAHFGKNHIGTDLQTLFDHVQRLHFDPATGRIDRWGDSPLPDWRMNTVHITNGAVQWIASLPAGQPYYVQLWHYGQHRPVAAATPGIGGPCRNGNWCDAVAEFDASVGAVVAAVDARGELDNTVFIVGSDNGPLATRRDQWGNIIAEGVILTQRYDEIVEYVPELLEPRYWVGGSNRSELLPLRDVPGKGSPAEGGIRVAMIIAGPTFAQGVIDWAPHSVMDIYATIEQRWIRDGRQFARDGVDLATPHEVHHIYRPRDGLRHAVIRDRWKYWLHTGRLYDVVADPGELHDLAAAHPGVIAKLLRLQPPPVEYPLP